MGKVAVGAAVVCTAAAVAVATLVVRHRMRSSSRWARALEILKDLEEKCSTPMAKLRQVADAMTVEMHAGLASEGGSKLKMLISYVDNLPTGCRGKGLNNSSSYEHIHRRSGSIHACRRLHDTNGESRFLCCIRCRGKGLNKVLLAFLRAHPLSLQKHPCSPSSQ